MSKPKAPRAVKHNRARIAEHERLQAGAKLQREYPRPCLRAVWPGVDGWLRGFIKPAIPLAGCLTPWSLHFWRRAQQRRRRDGLPFEDRAAWSARRALEYAANPYGFVRVYCDGHTWTAGSKVLTPGLQPHEAGYRAVHEPPVCPRCGKPARTWSGPVSGPAGIVTNTPRLGAHVAGPA